MSDGSAIKISGRSAILSRRLGPSDLLLRGEWSGNNGGLMGRWQALAHECHFLRWSAKLSACYSLSLVPTARRFRL
ncbi:MAG: hypothetical protein ACM3ZE_09130, partial [Myxococcales bacterium]